MIFKKNKTTANDSSNPKRIGRNTVKPETDKNSPFNNSARRIDDFSRPNGYHSSLPNINNQIAPDNHHSKPSGENIFSKTNSSEDLSQLMQKNKTNKSKKPKKSLKKRIKHLIIFALIIFLVVMAIKFLPNLIDIYQKNLG